MTVTTTPVPVLPPSAGAGVSLENYANRVASPVQDPAKADDARDERWRARGLLWRVSSLPRVRSCGRVAVTAGGDVAVRADGRKVGFAGLASCGSVWACPVCNSKIQAVRRLEIGVAVSSVLGQGGGAMFGAYTLRHHSLSDPDLLWRSLSKCWQAVARDRGVKEARADLQHVGFVRAAEVTLGGNGWHPHLHPIHLFDRAVTDNDATALHTEQVRAWTSAAERLGLEAPSTLAQHLHRVVIGGAASALSEYLSKVSWEMTSSQSKTGRDSRTPWEILRSVRDTEDASAALDDLALWRQFERFSKGKRALTWSRGLRARAGLLEEATDEEVAAAVVGTGADSVLVVQDWRPIAAKASLGSGLLRAVGTGGDAQAGSRFCTEHGIPHSLVRSGDLHGTGINLRVVQRRP